MLKNKLEKNIGKDNHVDQPLNSGNFSGAFPIETKSSGSEVRE